MLRINKAAVLGSGVMGASIAGHLANCGIYTYLLDIVPAEEGSALSAGGANNVALACNTDRKMRNRLADAGLARLFKENPAPLYTKDVASLIHTGNFEDDWSLLSEADWIIEVVVENLTIKQDLFAKIEQIWRPGMIVSSNTSGISINEMMKGRSLEFRKHFFGTHFFNPPRYMKLLEIIPNADSHEELVEQFKSFAEERLGKGVVLCKDTPNFIANRVGTYGLQVTLQVMQEMGLGPDEVDALTGRVMGRPKSATFRTLDLVGIDTFVHVTNNVCSSVSDAREREVFAPSPLLMKMVEMGMLGAKSGQGFYKKVSTPEGKSILALDYNSMEYRQSKKVASPSLEKAKRAKSLSEKLCTLLYADDEAGKLTWEVTKRTLLYAADRLAEIADDLVSVDRAMRWGFNWELGPFEMWDAIGLERSVQRMREEGESIPAWVEELLTSGATSFYVNQEGSRQFAMPNSSFLNVPEHKKAISLTQLKASGRVIRSNSGASLIDMGDDIACLEFHSPKQAIGPDIISMINLAVQEVRSNYRGLVIGNQGSNFCVGANIMLMLMEAQDHNWADLDMMVRQFQNTMGSLRYLERPVVAAPFGMALGGGVEVCLPCDRVQASAETYMGLVEVGVGLIPGGGGNKEMLMRWTEGVDSTDRVMLQPLMNHVFMAIGQAKVSTSALDARKYKFVRQYDSITANQDHLLYEAKQTALGLAMAGYQPPSPRKIPVVGETGCAVLRFGAYDMWQSGYISEHDYKIGCKLAYVLSGGNLPEGSLVSEQYLLDLEREAFLSLLGEPKTQQRMQHMLTKGKPLRN